MSPVTGWSLVPRLTVAAALILAATSIAAGLILDEAEAATDRVKPRASAGSGETTRFRQAGSGAMTRATLTWSTDDTDIDLHVWDAQGEHAWFSERDGIPGSMLTRDIVTGFGPESFVDRRPRGGRPLTYGVCYYSERGQGATRVQLRLTDPDGQQRTVHDVLTRQGQGTLLATSPDGSGFRPRPGWCGGGGGQRESALPAVESAPFRLRPGAVATLWMDVGSLRMCALSFAGARGRHGRERVTRSGRRYVRWRWRVSRSARAGAWDAVITCARSRRALRRGQGVRRVVRLLVERNGSGGGGIVAGGSLRVRSFGAAPSGRAHPSAGVVIRGTRNPFSAGTCLSWVYERRPGLYAIAVRAGVPSEGQVGPGGAGHWWDPWRWLLNARAGGVPTGSAPRPGAVAVFPRGYAGSAVGHLAIVENVLADGTYIVSERGWNGSSDETRRRVRPAPGVVFVYETDEEVIVTVPVPPATLPPPAPSSGGQSQPPASGSSQRPPATPPPAPSPAPEPPAPSPAPEPPPPASRFGITSYDRMSPGAPHNGYFIAAWQDFVARSDTLTYVAATVGNPRLEAGRATEYQLRMRICTREPDASDGNCPALRDAAPRIINYGETGQDIGDLPVTRGGRYWLVWYQPPAVAGTTWNTYWWEGGSTVTRSEQMKAVVRGYDR